MTVLNILLVQLLLNCLICAISSWWLIRYPQAWSSRTSTFSPLLTSLLEFHVLDNIVAYCTSSRVGLGPSFSKERWLSEIIDCIMIGLVRTAHDIRIHSVFRAFVGLSISSRTKVPLSKIVNHFGI